MSFQVTTCPYCSCGCGLLLNVEGNRLVGTHPSRAHPISNGSLCIRGWNCVDAPYDRERLTSAMVRKEGVLVPVSWQEAVTEIASRLKTRNIPERVSTPSDEDVPSILFAVGPVLANEDLLAVRRLAQFLGGHACGTDLSGVPVARHAIRKVLGNGYLSRTLDFLADADLVWILAADLENFPQVSSRLAQASRKGAKFVQFDVYSSATLGGNTTAVSIPPHAFGILPHLFQTAALELDTAIGHARHPEYRRGRQRQHRLRRI